VIHVHILEDLQYNWIVKYEFIKHEPGANAWCTTNQRLLVNMQTGNINNGTKRIDNAHLAGKKIICKPLTNTEAAGHNDR